MEYYKDGKLKNSNESTTTLATLSRTNQYLGRSNWPGDEYFNGSIDDFRVYDRALSANEIRLLYEAEAELPEQSVTSAKLSPALSDLIDGNGSLEQALPAGST